MTEYIKDYIIFANPTKEEEKNQKLYHTIDKKNCFVSPEGLFSCIIYLIMIIE